MSKDLTVTAIEKLKPGPARREIPDGKISGLFLVLQPSGAKSWAVRYRFRGKPRKFTIGAYPGIDLATARRRAQEALGQVAADLDPAELKQAAKASAREDKRAHLDVVERVIDQFIERHARANTRDWRETERLLKKDVLPAWAGRRLSEIGRAEVHDLIDAIVDRGAAVTANRTFAQLRKMSNWAVERGLIDKSPCDGLRPPTIETSRDRVLFGEEIVLVWRAAGTLGWPFGPIIQLLILTGQRRDEVAGARWSEIDIEKRVWNLPAERSKNRRPHTIPLSAPALEIIEALPRFEDSGFLFSAGANPPSGFSKAKPRLDKAIANLREGEGLQPFVIHDIRRSVASGLASIGVNLPVIERLLNHVSGSFGGIVGVYQKHSFADEMRAAVDAWARHVDALATGRPGGNIIDLAKARG
jgi:integrase